MVPGPIAARTGGRIDGATPSSDESSRALTFLVSPEPSCTITGRGNVQGKIHRRVYGV